MTYRDRGWLYAFRREADARTYFGPRVAHQLAAGGYVLNVYQVPWHRHAIGRINMLFDRAASRLVRTINMETYARQLAAELATLRAIQVAGDITPMTHRVAA
jgi:hypothetical protein